MNETVRCALGTTTTRIEQHIEHNRHWLRLSCSVGLGASSVRLLLLLLSLAFLQLFVPIGFNLIELDCPVHRTIVLDKKLSTVDPSMDLCEFLAEDSLIDIVPTFRYNKQLNLICGNFGPFRPSVPIKVPIWLAINLHRQNKCSIVSPNWVHELPKIQESQENETNKLLAPPDDHWKETLKLFEQEFGRSIQCSDLIERREAILKKSVHELFREARDKNSLFIGDVTLDNATPAELILVKEMISKGFKRLQELRKTAIFASSRKHY